MNRINFRPFPAVRLLTALLVLGMLLAAVPSQPALAQDDDLEANKSIVLGVIEDVYNQGNLDAVGDYFAPGFVDNTREGPVTYDTVEAYQENLAGMMAEMPSFQVNVEDMIAEGDRVVTRFTVDFSDGEFSVSGMLISRIADGKVVEEWEVADELSLMTHLGMLPPMEEAAPGPVSIAGGFNGPMGVLVDPDGNVWVVDTGMGGDAEVEMMSPESGELMAAAMGDTARIVQIAPDGTQTDVAMLPSIMISAEEAVGGSRLALLDGELYATAGIWIGEEDRPPLMASIVKVSDGEPVEVASTWDLEVSENPGGFVVDSHPYGLSAGPDGNLWVADAGGNTLLNVDPESGEVNLIVTFDGLPGPFPNPFRDDAMEMDPVPTAVAFDEDLNVYVSLLTGFPFPVGGAKVVMISPDGTISDYATGLTMPTDLRVGPDGEMYAVQFGQFTEQGPVPASGAIVRVGAGDSSEIVVDGLSFPTSIDFNADGDAYISINGVGPPGSGEIVMVAGLTDMAGTPVGAMAEEAPMEEVPMLPETAMGPEIPQDTGYLIDDMGDGLYILSDGLYQIMFLTTGEGVIVVDAPPNLGENILAAIAEVTDEPITHVIYTHAHADHIGAAGIFPEDVTIIAHVETAEHLANVGADDSARELPFAMFVGGGPVPLPTETFEDGYTLEVGNQVLELDYYGANHMPGNIFVYAPEQGVLMLIDVIFPGWAPFKNLALAENVPGYIDAHEVALDYDFDTFVGGHVTRLGTREDIETQLAYVLDVQANAVEALQSVDFMAVAQEVNFGYGDMWVLFDAYLGALADTCTDLTLEDWGGQLGGIETVAESHCATMLNSVRLD